MRRILLTAALALVAARVLADGRTITSPDDASGKCPRNGEVWLKTDGHRWECKLGTWVAISSAGGSSGGAPTSAKYITQTADVDLSAEQAMSALGTGLVKNATTTGVQSIYAGTSCTNQAVTALDASGAATCSSITSSFITGTFPATAHALLGSGHSDATTGTVLRGDLVTGQGGAPTWTRLGIGSANTVLKSDGTDASWGTVPDAALASSYSGVGACGANTWASTLNDNAGPTCTQPAFSDISGAVTDGQVPNTITVDLATAASALAANPADCATSTHFAVGIAADGTATCEAIADADVPNSITIDLATAASALAANGANCSGNDFSLGVDASGVAECAQPAFSNLSGSATDAQVPDNITVTLAATASALAADPSDCATSTHFAVGITAAGTATCEAIADADVPNTITVDLATAATALNANGANCSGNNFALGVDASGVGECAQPAFSNLSGAATDAQVPDNITVTLAGTATALAANGGNCSGNNFALGVDASGVGECAQPAFSNLSGAATDAQVPNTITVDLAAAATALAADPADCATSTHFAVGVNAAGTATCEAIADADVPNTITIDLATLATTASTANAGDSATAFFSAGTLETGIGGTGNATGVQTYVFFATTTAPACTVGGTTTFLGPSGAGSTTEASVVRYVVPLAGTLKNLRAWLGGNLPASETLVVKVVKGGAAQASPTCTISAGAAVCNDTSNSFAVVAGDTLNVQVACSGATSALNARASVSFTIQE